MVVIFWFIMIVDANIPFLLTLWKPDTQTLDSVIWIFSIWCIFTKWWPIFKFFIMADTNILFLLTIGKSRNPNFGGSIIWKFSVWYIFMRLQQFFYFFIMVDANIPFSKCKISISSVTHIYKMAAIFVFFIMTNANILFPKCKFQLVQFPWHHTTSSLFFVSTFKYNDVSMFKTYMCAYSCVMSFLH